MEIVRVVAVVLLVSGCDVVFRLDHVPDAQPIDAPPPCIVTESFTGTRLADQWSTYMNNALYAVSQDETLRLDLSAAPSSVGEAGARYTVSFDLRGGSVEVEVPQVIAAHPNIENYIRVRAGTDTSRSYVIRYGNGSIDFRTRDGTNYIHRMRSYNPVADRFWRISNGPEPDQVSFSTRANATAEWVVETMQPAAIPFDDMQVLLVAGTFLTGSLTPGFALYDNFAVCGARAL